MRLIDADKLKQHYRWWNNEEQRLFDEIVDAQPMVIPMPPEPGRWVEDEYGFVRCSQCGMEWDEPEHPETNYCPNCGAKMCPKLMSGTNGGDHDAAD